MIGKPFGGAGTKRPFGALGDGSAPANKKEPRRPVDIVDQELVIAAVLAIMHDSGAVGDKYMRGSLLSAKLSHDAALSDAVACCKSGKGWLKNLLEGEPRVAQVFPEGIGEPCFQLVGDGTIPDRLSPVGGNYKDYAPPVAGKPKGAGAGSRPSITLGKHGGGSSGGFCDGCHLGWAAGCGYFGEPQMASSSTPGIWDKYGSGSFYDGSNMGWMVACAYFGDLEMASRKFPPEFWDQYIGKGGYSACGKGGSKGPKGGGKGGSKGPKGGGSTSTGSKVTTHFRAAGDVKPEEIEKGMQAAGESAINLIIAAIMALRELSGTANEYVAGSKLASKLQEDMPEEVQAVKAAFGGKGWLKKMLASNPSIVCAIAPGYDEPCYRLATSCQ